MDSISVHLVPGGILTFRDCGSLYAILAIVEDEHNEMIRVFSLSVFGIESAGVGFDYKPSMGAGVQWKPLKCSYLE